MARGRKRLSTAEQIEKTEAMVLQKKEELDELVAELKRLREIEKKENQAALLAAVAKSKWSFEQIVSVNLSVSYVQNQLLYNSNDQRRYI